MSKRDIENNKYFLPSEILKHFPQSWHMRLHSIYNLTVSPSWSFFDRRNEDQHLLFVQGGRGYYRLEDREIPLGAGMIVFVSNGFLHEARADSDDPPQIIPIRFGFYENGTGRACQCPDSPTSVVMHNVDLVKYRVLFEQLYRSFFMDDFVGRSLASGLLLSVLAEMQSDFSVLNCQTDKRINSILDFIECNPDARHSVGELAQKSCMSKKHFTRLFRMQTGMTPAVYCRHLLCRHACHMLSETSLGINEISMSLGFTDQYVFSKLFKKIIGCPPTHYRHHNS